MLGRNAVDETESGHGQVGHMQKRQMMGKESAVQALRGMIGTVAGRLGRVGRRIHGHDSGWRCPLRSVMVQPASIAMQGGLPSITGRLRAETDISQENGNLVRHITVLQRINAGHEDSQAYGEYAQPCSQAGTGGSFHA